MKIIPTVHELRKKGFNVKLNHHRRFFRFDPFSGKRHTVVLPWHLKEESFKDYFLDPMGGETHVVISMPDQDSEGFHGIAVCSISDHFCRKDGIKKSIARALANAVV